MAATGQVWCPRACSQMAAGLRASSGCRAASLRSRMRTGRSGRPGAEGAMALPSQAASGPGQRVGGGRMSCLPGRSDCVRISGLSS